MKKVMDKFDNMVIVGSASEIKAVVKSVRRAYCKYATSWFTSHCDMPKFNPTRGYALIFDEDDQRIYTKPVDMYLVKNVL